MPKRDAAYMADRRERIILAAREIIRDRGLAALSTSELCRAAGISMGALYTHFKSKDEVLHGLAQWTTGRLSQLYEVDSFAELRAALMTRAAEVSDPATRRAFRADVELIAAAAADPRLEALWASYRDSRHLAETLRRLAARGQLRGEVDIEAAAGAIEALLVGLGFISLIGGKTGLEPVRALSLVLDGLQPC